jgi:hypothetical protein
MKIKGIVAKNRVSHTRIYFYTWVWEAQDTRNLLAEIIPEEENVLLLLNNIILSLFLI